MEHEFYHIVPKDPLANIEFRQRMIRWGSSSRENAQTLWTMCSRDILFWINTFCMTHDPRLANPVIPFNTYEFQDEVITRIEEAIDTGNDFLVEKTRDMGGSWCCVIVFLHQFIFRDNRAFLMSSSKEDRVDKRGDPSSLMYKMDLVLKYMPGWLRPSVTRNKLAFRNEDNGSTIDGESTTGDIGRGGRNTATLHDEFTQVVEDVKVLAATRDNTNCRILNSTPNYRGTNCAFYELAQKMPESQKARMHWTLHPEKSKGLYLDAAGNPRSPWYDKQCARAHSAAEIAIELDIDYLGAASGYFDQVLIDRLKGECHTPIVRGEIVIEQDTNKPKFVEIASGMWRLWRLPNEDGKWDGEFSIGVDVSYGKGATNSTMSVVDKKTGEKVASAASAFVEPHKWSEHAVNACKWWNNAYLIWEANGPGRIFGDNVVELGYRNFYYRQKRQTLGKDSTETYGWQNNQGGLVDLLGEYQKALRTGAYRNPCKDALSECLQYTFNKNGNLQHGGAMAASDPSGARDNHGDMVVADALSYRGMKEIPWYEPKPEETKHEYLSFGWRLEQRQERSRLAKVGGTIW